MKSINPTLKKSIKISNYKGNLKKLINKKSLLYKGFGELYLTSIKKNKIKGWKLHKKKHSNIFLISGKVMFVFVNILKTKNLYKEYLLDSNINNHIYIPPNIYFCFKGISKTPATLINFSSLEHDDKEVINKKLNFFGYKWKK